MSGGSLNYFFTVLSEHEGDFKDAELDELVKDLSVLYHDREWFLSGDIGEGQWRESRDKFKDKWFTPQGRLERFDKYLDNFRDEIIDSLGKKEDICKNCSHWTQTTGQYGRCDVKLTYLTHSCDACDKNMFE